MRLLVVVIAFCGALSTSAQSQLSEPCKVIVKDIFASFQVLEASNGELLALGPGKGPKSEVDQIDLRVSKTMSAYRRNLATMRAERCVAEDRIRDLETSANKIEDGIQKLIRMYD